MYRVLEIHRGSWKDMFIERRLDYLPEGGERWVMWFLLIFMNFGATFAVLYSPIAALLLKSENLTTANYGQVVSVVGLSLAFFGLVQGQIADHFPRSRLFLWGFIPAIFLHFVMAFLPDGHPTEWVILYILLAFTERWAASVLWPLMRDFTPRNHRSGALGMYQVGNNFTTVVALTMAAVLLEVLGNRWQSMYFIYGCISLVLFIVGVLYIREPSPGLKAQIVYSDQLVKHAEQRAPEIEREGIKVTGMFRFLFAGWETWFVAVGTGLQLVGYTTFTTYSTLYLVQGLGKSPAYAALMASVFFWGRTISIGTTGHIADYFKVKKIPCVFGTILQGMGIAAMHLFNPDTPDWIVLADLLFASVIGAATWGPSQALFAEAAEKISPTRIATAYAAQNITTSIITQSWAFILPLLVLAISWQNTLVVSGACSALAAIFFLQSKSGPLFGRVKDITSLDQLPEADSAAAAIPTAQTSEAAGE